MKTYLATPPASQPCLCPLGFPLWRALWHKESRRIRNRHHRGLPRTAVRPTVSADILRHRQQFRIDLPVPSTLTASPALSDQQAFPTVDLLSQPTYVTVTSCYPDTTAPVARQGHNTG